MPTGIYERTAYHIRRLSEGGKRKILTESHKLAIAKAHIKPRKPLICPCGKIFTVHPYRENIAIFCSSSCRSKLRPHKRGYKCFLGSKAKLGVLNPNFGKIKQYPSYSGIHHWVKKRLIKSLTCEHCGQIKPLDMANKSRTYKRDLSDWFWLCRKCHLYYDGHIKNLELGRKKLA